VEYSSPGVPKQPVDLRMEIDALFMRKRSHRREGNGALLWFCGLIFSTSELGNI